MLKASTVHQILDAARWAPSGDNTQPWRFEIVDETAFVIHGSDTRAHCVYDLDGRPSQLSLGALIETVCIAATAFGMRAAVQRRPNLSDSHPVFDVKLIPDASVVPSALIPAIPLRSVQRRPYSARPLSLSEKLTMSQTLDPGWRIVWLEGAANKWRTAWLMFANAKLRLTTEEAYRVHRDIIHWGRRYSPDRVPDQALGVDTLTLKLMQWIMRDWARVRFFNRFLAGTWMPRLQMDFLPSLMCAAHFVLLRDTPPTSIDDHVDAGRMVQRLWLAATALGLMHQPELTPLIFSRYVRNGLAFSNSPSALALAKRLAGQTARLLGPELPCSVWMGRIGAAPSPTARSTRRALGDLVKSPVNPLRAPAASQADKQ